MADRQRWPRRVVEDIRHGRYKEAYGLFVIGVVLAALGVFDIVSTHIVLSTILLALSFLVFRTSVEASSGKPELDRILVSREEFGSFSKLLPGVRDLRIYGPTAINVLAASADIRRFVLDNGGIVRVIIQESTKEAIRQTAIQLDDNFDLEQTLRNSQATLDRLRIYPKFSYRSLAINPGFSLVIVNADARGGYVIFESHGFKDDNIADRMHIRIDRSESPRWFMYWVSRFDAMWEASQSTKAGIRSTEAIPDSGESAQDA